MSCLLALAAAGRAFGESYRLPGDGRLSLGVYKDGRLVRSLAAGKPAKAGNHELAFDGKDDAGRKLPPGDYELRGLLDRGIAAEYDFSIGQPGSPAYVDEHGRGGWGGVWGSVIDIESRDGFLYLLWAMEEGQGGLMKATPAGEVIWRAHLPGSGGPDSPLQAFGVHTALAVDGEFVYAALDAAPELGSWLTAETRQAAIWKVRADTGRAEPFELRPGLPYPVSRAHVFFDTIREAGNRVPHTSYEANVRGLAAGDGKLFVPLYFEDKVEVYDAADGTLLSSRPVPKPLGVSYHEGGLLVASGKQILRVDDSGSTVAAGAGLAAPFAAAVAPSGELWVADLGAAQQVKRFTPGGKPLGAWGARGGRPWRGRYKPGDFFFPVALAFLPDGSVAVAEDAPPRRVGFFSPSGRWLRDWIGPQYFSGNIGVDPAGTVVFLNGQGVSTVPMVYAVDFDKKIWSVASYSMGASWGFFPYERRSLGLGQYRPFMRARDGKSFVVAGGDNHPIHRLEAGVLVPAAAVGSYLPQSVPDGWALKPDSPYDFSKYDSRQVPMFTWRDLDGDGFASDDEVEEHHDAPWLSSNWGSFAAKNLDLYFPDFNGSAGRGVRHLPCSGLDERGNPVYDVAKMRPLLQGKFKGEAPIWVADDGAIYAADAELHEGESREPAWAGIGQVKAQRLLKFDPQGRLLWQAGRKAARQARAGESYKVVSIAGLERGFVFFVDANGQIRVYSEDGLYAADLLEDPFEGYFDREYMAWWEALHRRSRKNLLNVELFGAWVFEEPKSRALYLMAGSDAVHFWRVEGLERVHRFAVPVALR